MPMIFVNELLLLFIVLFISTTETLALISIKILSMEPLVEDQILRPRQTGESTIDSFPISASRRRSPRLVALDSVKHADGDDSNEPFAADLEVSLVNLDSNKRRRRNPATKSVESSEQYSSDVSDGRRSIKKMPAAKNGVALKTLPRTVEESVRSRNARVQYVLGIDEAGRGPLAGPVVVAAVRMATGHPDIVKGVTDSKKITAEAQREILYEQIIESLRDKNCSIDSKANESTSSSTNVLWAIAVVDAVTIDKINILQATLLGMELVASAILEQPIDYPIFEHTNEIDITHHSNCFVVVGRSHPLDPKSKCNGSKKKRTITETESASSETSTTEAFYALIDGNRLPKNMPCPAEAMIKGDSREYCIAAASILAKVTRDRIMHRYHAQYPEYNFAQHKGYPTAGHVQAIRIHGPSPLHRMSFAPLKKPTKASKK